MKSQISEFCNEFSETLFPLSQLLRDTVDQMEAVETAFDQEGITSSFSEIFHRLEALINKVQGQEAYVLLFGPLKSGKSTLINAISAGYVSEVTSLPAYPCMVYLKYGETPSYSVFRYSGKREELDSPDQLKDLLEQSHRTLSERIRAMDDFGETFDPATHLPSAIRRVQVELPAKNLKESGTVLVDTPGLYSKMKFGYDVMTREFRDSAACAVFVVKTDNLFLEQVFDDFNDLLEQFSRVFVVVNIDKDKSDLRPDGSLTPSLESRDPDKIVEAFEMLTMSAPLRRAAETGRLHLYPIDLRSAAARRLQASAAPVEPLAPVDDADEEPDAFDAFLNDLMNYLGSTDYLREFMTDTIRQSGKICQEIKQHCASHSESVVDAERSRQQKALEDIVRKQKALELASATAPGEWMAETLERLKRERDENVDAGGLAFKESAAPVISGWLESDESLADLKSHLQGLMDGACESFLADEERRLAQCALSAHAGFCLSPSESEAFGVLGIALPRLADEAFEESATPALDTAGQEPDLDPFPVRRGFADKLLFRSADMVRKKLFRDPAQNVSAKAKRSRLREDADEAILALAVSELEQRLERLSLEVSESAVAAYVEGVSRRVRAACANLGKELDSQEGRTKQTMAKLQELREKYRHLSDLAEEVSGTVHALEEQHAPQLEHAGL
ncbi:dynamin family protein [Haliea sp. E1-2-M8]|uniref:dynamin family protein n=1 Tax=Haliea sp. E1-2-M8 TaxID=3064706 RepID=UPI002717D33E|nr:dynamin family protein [Haliea sp. E1-2-M8]MDO8863130.1 dynamin family protein [Haliea sp. E1-2-M8]